MDGGPAAAAVTSEVPADGGLRGAALLGGLWHVFECSHVRNILETCAHAKGSNAVGGAFPNIASHVVTSRGRVRDAAHVSQSEQ